MIRIARSRTNGAVNYPKCHFFHASREPASFSLFVLYIPSPAALTRWFAPTLDGKADLARKRQKFFFLSAIIGKFFCLASEIGKNSVVSFLVLARSNERFVEKVAKVFIFPGKDVRLFFRNTEHCVVPQRSHAWQLWGEKGTVYIWRHTYRNAFALSQ